MPYAFADLEVLRQADRLHQRERIESLVHAANRLVVHVLHGVAQASQFVADQVCPDDGIEVAGEEQLRPQARAWRRTRRVGQCEAAAIAPDRVEVRHVREQGSQRVAAERGSSVRGSQTRMESTVSRLAPQINSNRTPPTSNVWRLVEASRPAARALVAACIPHGTGHAPRRFQHRRHEVREESHVAAISEARGSARRRPGRPSCSR